MDRRAGVISDGMEILPVASDKGFLLHGRELSPLPVNCLQIKFPHRVLFTERACLFDVTLRGGELVVA